MLLLVLLLPSLWAGEFTLKGGFSAAHQMVRSEKGERRYFFAPGFGSHVEYVTDGPWRVGVSGFGLLKRRVKLFHPDATGLYSYAGFTPVIRYYSDHWYLGGGPIWSLRSQNVSLPGLRRITTRSFGGVALFGLRRDSWFAELAYGRQRDEKTSAVDQEDVLVWQRRGTGRSWGTLLVFTLGKTVF